VEAELKEDGKLEPEDRIQIVVGTFDIQSLLRPSLIKGLLNDPVVKAEADWAAFHPYSMNAKASLFEYDYFVSLAESCGFGNRIWVNEMGYPSAGGTWPSRIIPERMPTELIKLCTYMAVRGAGHAFWYQLHDAEAPNEYTYDIEDYFGLLEADKHANFPNYHAPALVIWGQNVQGYTFRRFFPDGDGIPADVFYYYFEKDAKRTMIVWLDGSGSKELSIRLPGSDRRYYDMDVSLWGPLDKSGSSLPIMEKRPPYEKTGLAEEGVYEITDVPKIFLWESAPGKKPVLRLQ
jgi:hypothetical protein